MQDISVIMLTFNEERHIRRALTNARKFAKDIFVVDCFSTDRTCEIAEEMGAHVYRHEWENHSKQLAWALKNLPLRTEWIWRQDADEYLTDELIDEIEQTLPKTDDSVGGYTAPCLRKFMGRYIKHGIVPLILLRLVRTRCARVENKMMDEHMQVTEGSVKGLKNAFFDDSLMTLTEWTQKHNGYATREAADLLCTEFGVGIDTKATAASGAHTASVRAKKLKYTKLPLFWRAFAFFVYRYFFRLGFLDGKEGFLWHFLQGFWYRSLADAKVFELKKRFGFDEEKIKQYLIDTYMDGNKMGGVKWSEERRGKSEKSHCLVVVYSHHKGEWESNTNNTKQRSTTEGKVNLTNGVSNTNYHELSTKQRSAAKGKANYHKLFKKQCSVAEGKAKVNLTNRLMPTCVIVCSKSDSCNSCNSCSKKEKYNSCSSVAEERRAYAA